MVLLKLIAFTILTIVLFSSFSQIFAQEFSLGDLAAQDLELTIAEDGKVHVIHNIIGDSSRTQQVPFVPGTYSNLKIYNEDGNEPTNSVVKSQNDFILLFPTSKDITVEYDLEDALVLKNGMWTWEFVYLAQTVFYFPEKADLVFANNRPVLIEDFKGMKCHGCQATIEYVIDEPVFNKVVKWEDKEYKVVFRTLSDIKAFEFDQPRTRIVFDIDEPGQHITMLIPLELLWNPYDVYLNEKNILKNRFLVNDTHVAFSVKPHTSGTITIIGISAIPEFPIFIPLFVGLTAVIILQFRSRLSLR